MIFLACLFFILTANIGYSQCCNYQIALYDTYGDGWNGGYLTVSVNGTPVLSNITLSIGGGPAYFQIPINPGDEISTAFTAGSWAYEPYYRILDCEGSIVGSAGPGAGGPGNLSGIIAVCTNVQSIPTLTEWGMILMALLLGSSALLVLKKQRVSKSTPA